MDLNETQYREQFANMVLSNILLGTSSIDEPYDETDKLIAQKILSVTQDRESIKAVFPKGVDDEIWDEEIQEARALAKKILGRND